MKGNCKSLLYVQSSLDSIDFTSIFGVWILKILPERVFFAFVVIWKDFKIICWCELHYSFKTFNSTTSIQSWDQWKHLWADLRKTRGKPRHTSTFLLLLFTKTTSQQILAQNWLLKWFINQNHPSLPPASPEIHATSVWREKISIKFNEAIKIKSRENAPSLRGWKHWKYWKHWKQKKWVTNMCSSAERSETFEVGNESRFFWLNQMSE